MDVLLDLLTTGSSAKVLAAAAAALRDLLVWPKAQARRTASVSCLVLHATLELFHVCFCILQMSQHRRVSHKSWQALDPGS